jgi:hypothetical protein
MPDEDEDEKECPCCEEGLPVFDLVYLGAAMLHSASFKGQADPGESARKAAVCEAERLFKTVSDLGKRERD